MSVSLKVLPSKAHPICRQEGRGYLYELRPSSHGSHGRGCQICFGYRIENWYVLNSRQVLRRVHHFPQEDLLETDSRVKRRFDPSPKNSRSHRKIHPHQSGMIPVVRSPSNNSRFCPAFSKLEPCHLPRCEINVALYLTDSNHVCRSCNERMEPVGQYRPTKTVSYLRQTSRARLRCWAAGVWVLQLVSIKLPQETNNLRFQGSHGCLVSTAGLSTDGKFPSPISRRHGEVSARRTHPQCAECMASIVLHLLHCTARPKLLSTFFTPVRGC